jgi:hypothetical protein
MLASLGFLVGEQVEGSSFLFDADVTGPAINHFQQVPSPFWAILGATILFNETNRVNVGPCATRPSSYSISTSEIACSLFFFFASTFLLYLMSSGRALPIAIEAHLLLC